MRTYLLLFVLATTTSLGLTPIVRRLCQRWRWLDEISDKRRLHRAATPRLGGVAVYISLIVGLLPLLLLDNGVTAALKAANGSYARFLVPATLTLLLGCIDDLRGFCFVPKEKHVGIGLIDSIQHLETEVANTAR